MARLSAALFMIFAFQIPGTLSAAGMILKISIMGGALAQPIVITDPAQLRKFGIGGGPGSTCNPHGKQPPKPACQAIMERSYSKSFIVDWSRGAINPASPYMAPISGLVSYEVEFLYSRTDGNNTYRVTYAYDPAKQEGFICIPAKGDPRYEENIRLIKRGVEGNWYHAWSEWDAVATALIGAARH